MGSDRHRRLLLAALAAVPLLGALTMTATGADAGAAWWTPVGLRGTAITGVLAGGRTIEVRTDSGQTLRSTDAGASFTRVAGDPELPAQRGTAAGPGSPDLGAGAHLIAAPAALPGVVVAVATDGTVWRRGQDGDWQRALLLLPRSLVQGVPRVTSITAFDRPLTGTVYLGTDGYSVLISTDGGDDWIRAGPGLPDSVYALVSDSTTRAVYAGTSDGLWMHVLQAFPAPPQYRDAALVWRWLGIGAVTVIAALMALLGILRLVPVSDSRR